MRKLRRVDTLVIHHTDSAMDTTVEEIREWHRARGFADIGYHWVIRFDPAAGWTVEPGRPAAYQGAHVKSHNDHTIGVVVCGNYSRLVPPPEVYEFVATVVAGLLRKYALHPNDVRGHREMYGARTECPGKFFDLDKLRFIVSEEHGPWGAF